MINATNEEARDHTLLHKVLNGALRYWGIKVAADVTSASVNPARGALARKSAAVIVCVNHHARKEHENAQEVSWSMFQYLVRPFGMLHKTKGLD